MAESVVGAHAIAGIGGLQDTSSTVQVYPPLQEQQPRPVEENEPHLVEAELVDPALLAQAEPMDMKEDDDEGNGNEDKSRNNTLAWMGGIFMVLIIVVAIVVVLVTNNNNDTSESITAIGAQTSPPAKLSTLESIREKGVLRCGVSQAIFSSEQNFLEGMENQVEALVCRAIAAAALGKNDFKFEMVPHDFPDRVPYITQGEVDVLFNLYSHTMDRDILPVALPDSPTNKTVGMSFSKPYWFISSAFGGWSKYVACAEQGMDMNLTECADTNVCTSKGLRYWSLLENTIPEAQRTLNDDIDGTFTGFMTGACNVMIGPASQMNAMVPILENAGVPTASDYTVGGLFSFEPAAIVTRDDDVHWTTFVDLVLQTLLIVQQHDVTQDSLRSPDSLQFPTISFFGNQSADMFNNLISLVGNYGQIQDRFETQGLVQDPMNFLNNGSTGIMYSLPLGFTESEGPGPALGGALAEILERGVLRCGVVGTRPGFVVDSGTLDVSVFNGMDVDYCRAVCAAVFGSEDALEIVKVDHTSEIVDLLGNGRLDVAAGMMGTLERTVHDNEFGHGFWYSRPYFYNMTALYEPNGTPTFYDADSGPASYLCMATRNDDLQWAKFVYWIVESLIYAEEASITKEDAARMPQVNLFGSGFQNMFQDSVATVGNYGSIYSQNLESIVPRDSLNNAYDKHHAGPLLFPLPHFIS